MRPGPARVGERDERVVVGLHALAPHVALAVDRAYGAEQLQRLVHQVAAEVVQQPAHLIGPAALAPAALGHGPPALEARLEAQHPAQQPLAGQAAHGAEVAVPAPVLEHGQQETTLLGQADQPAPLLGGPGQRLVHDHGQALGERRRGRGDVGAVGRGDHDEVTAAPQVLHVVHRGRAVRGGDLGPAIGVPGHDGGQGQAGGGVDQRGVEVGPRGAVADEADTDVRAGGRLRGAPRLRPVCLIAHRPRLSARPFATVLSARPSRRR
ncbi:hypothetical protein GCM10020001_017580 [Nonomuraea salmonea]